MIVKVLQSLCRSSIVCSIFFNSRGAFAKGYKSPILVENLEDTEIFFNECKVIAS